LKILTTIPVVFIATILTACGGGGSGGFSDESNDVNLDVGSQPPTARATGAPGLTFTAQNNSVVEGGTTQLRWNATDVKRCRSRANPDHPDWVDLQRQAISSDGFSITNIRNNTNFVLTCRGNDNSIVRETLRITVTPAGTVTPAVDISLRLFDAASDRLIADLSDGVTVDVTGVAVDQRTIVAQVTDVAVESVSFELRNTESNSVISNTENIVPYALFADSNNSSNDLFPGTIPNGSYTLLVSAFSEDKGAGNLLGMTTQTITLNSSSAPEDGDDDGDGILNIADRCPATPAGVSVDREGCSNEPLGLGSFVLIDADRDQVITEIVDGQVLDLASLPPNLTLEVRAEPQIQNVEFVFDQLVSGGSDSTRPFTLGGERRAADGSIDYTPWSLSIPRPLDRNKIELTAVASNGGSTIRETIRFDLVDQRPRVLEQAVAHGVNDYASFGSGSVPSYAWTLDDPNDQIVLYAEIDAGLEDVTRWINWYNDCNHLYELVLDRPAFTTTDANFGRSKIFASLAVNLCTTSNAAGCGNKVVAQGLNTIRNASRNPESILPHWVLTYEMGRGGSSEPFYQRGIWPTQSWNEAMPHTMAAVCFHSIQGDAALESSGATPGRLINEQLSVWETLDIEFAEFFNVERGRTPEGTTVRMRAHDLVAAMLSRVVQETDPYTIRDIFRRLKAVPVRDNSVAAMCDFVNAVNAETDNRFNSRMRGVWGLPDRCPAG